MLLLKHGSNPNSQDCIKHTPLFNAAKLGSDSIVQALLDKGGNPNLGSKIGMTPLHLACQNGQRCAMLLLLSHGANPFARDEKSHTPCQLAAQQGSLKHMCLIQALLTMVREKPAHLRDITELVNLGDDKLNPKVRELLDFWLRAVVRGRKLALPPKDVFESEDPQALAQYLKAQMRAQNLQYASNSTKPGNGKKRTRDLMSGSNLYQMDFMTHHRKDNRHVSSNTSGSGTSSSGTSTNNSSSGDSGESDRGKTWNDQEDADSDDCATEEELEEDEHQQQQQQEYQRNYGNARQSDFTSGNPAASKRVCT